RLRPVRGGIIMASVRRLPLCLASSVMLLLSAPAASVAADEPAEQKVELKKGDRIIFFGDSLTYLAGKEEPPKIVTKGYVRIVRETLDAKHKDRHQVRG